MAYNVAANQVNAKPVSGYMEGRALVLGEQAKKQEMELNDRNMAVREDQEARLQDEAKAAQREKAAEQSQAYYKDPELRTVNKDLVSKANTPEGTKAWLEHVQSVSPDHFEANIKDKWDMNEDGILDENIRQSVLQQTEMIEQLEREGRHEELEEHVEISRILMSAEPGSPEHEGAMRRKAELDAELAKTQAAAQPKVDQTDRERNSAAVLEVLRRKDLSAQERAGMLEALGVEGKDIIQAVEDELVVSELPGETLWDVAGDATGLWAGLRELYSLGAGNVGLPIAEETLKGRQLMKTESQALVKALSNNPRYPVSEMNWIRKEVANIEPSIAAAPSVMRARMVSLHESLSRRAELDAQDARDPSLPPKKREEARQAATEIQRFLRVLGVPQGTKTAPPEAVQHLLDNPGLKEQFQKKYGYLPEELNE